MRNSDFKVHFTFSCCCVQMTCRCVLPYSAFRSRACVKLALGVDFFLFSLGNQDSSLCQMISWFQLPMEFCGAQWQIITDRLIPLKPSAGPRFVLHQGLSIYLTRHHVDLSPSRVYRHFRGRGNFFFFCSISCWTMCYVIIRITKWKTEFLSIISPIVKHWCKLSH